MTATSKIRNASTEKVKGIGAKERSPDDEDRECTTCGSTLRDDQTDYCGADCAQAYDFDECETPAEEYERNERAAERMEGVAR